MTRHGANVDSDMQMTGSKHWFGSDFQHFHWAAEFLSSTFLGFFATLCPK
jgi:hypothetical protein